MRSMSEAARQGAGFKLLEERREEWQRRKCKQAEANLVDPEPQPLDTVDHDKSEGACRDQCAEECPRTDPTPQPGAKADWAATALWDADGYVNSIGRIVHRLSTREVESGATGSAIMATISSHPSARADATPAFNRPKHRSSSPRLPNVANRAAGWADKRDRSGREARHSSGAWGRSRRYEVLRSRGADGQSRSPA